ncbi:hypothetical protein [Nocardia neocaledoniensis]|nr:hypothetical protein [Nocardia neocaledoniensis]
MILAGWALAVLVPLAVLIGTIAWPSPSAPSGTDEIHPENARG